MYQQQNHPIDDIIRQHTHGIPPAVSTGRIKIKVKSKKQIKEQPKPKTGKYGYTYNRDGTFQ